MTSPIQLMPYQQRWIKDNSPLKIVVKARQIGYSFAATLRVALECISRKTTWILLSKGERQSRLLMDKVREHLQACGVAAQNTESQFFEGTSLKQLEARLPNGSVICALPANPDTARGYSGNVTLDEFAFHQDADKIYAALYPSITRGYQLEVISTPNGKQGKFYELAKAAGLTEQVPGVGCQVSGEERPRLGGHPDTRNLKPGTWSAHYCDIYDAVRQGLKINVQRLRAGCEEESAWQQEFCCQFVSAAENFIPPELFSQCVSADADVEGARFQVSGEEVRGARYEVREKGARYEVRGASEEAPSSSSHTSHLAPSTFFLGIDIGRKHDRTVFWVDEMQVPGVRYQVSGKSEEAPISLPHTSHLTPRTSSDTSHPAPETWQLAPVSVTRLVRTLSNVPYDQQREYARRLLLLRHANGAFLIHRVGIDATGMGAPLAESLAQEFGARVEPVVFTAAVKEDLAYRTRRRMESGLTLLPDSRDIRRAFAAVKKFVTVSGNVRFDAARTDAGHADEFWAKALADLAAETRPVARASDGYLAAARPMISPAAFMTAAPDWAATLTRTVF